MHRLRFTHEVDGDRAKHVGQGFANLHLSALQKGTGAYYRQHRHGGLVEAEVTGDLMYQRDQCIAQASICREKAQADPARHDYWIDQAVAWLQRAIQARRGKAVTYDIRDGLADQARLAGVTNSVSQDLMVQWPSST
jgi:hypothetical protein